MSEKRDRYAIICDALGTKLGDGGLLTRRDMGEIDAMDFAAAIDGALTRQPAGECPIPAVDRCVPWQVMKVRAETAEGERDALKIELRSAEFIVESSSHEREEALDECKRRGEERDKLKAENVGLRAKAGELHERLGDDPHCGHGFYDPAHCGECAPDSPPAETGGKPSRPPPDRETTVFKPEPAETGGEDWNDCEQCAAHGAHCGPNVKVRCPNYEPKPAQNGGGAFPGVGHQESQRELSKRVADLEDGLEILDRRTRREP